MGFTRNYTGRLRCTVEQENLLQENYDNWQKLFKVGYDRLGTIFGSFNPTDANVGPMVDEESTDGKSKGLFSFIEDKAERYQAYKTAIAFLNWFPVEEVQEDNNHFVVTFNEAVERFKKYWLPEFGNYSSKVLEGLASININAEAAFIDRRGKFQKSGLDAKEIYRHIFEDQKDKLNFKGAFNQKSQEFRGILSTHFGQGKKTSIKVLQEIVDRINAVKNYIKKQNKDSIETVEILSLLKEFPPLSEPKRGRTSKWLSYLKAKEVNTKKYLVVLEDELESKNRDIEQRRSGDYLGEEYRKFFIEELEKIVPFEKNNEFYYAAYTLPCGQIMSHRSNGVRRISDHCTMYFDNQRRAREVPQEIEFFSEFAKSMERELSFEEGRTYTVRENQGNGLDHFMKCMNQGLKFDACIKSTESFLNVKALRGSSMALLKYVHEEKCEYNVGNLLSAITWHDQEDTLSHSRLGYVCDVMKKHLHPQYGSSKPKSNLFVEEGKLNVELVLITSDGVKAEQFPLEAKRAEKEYLFTLFGSEKSEEIPKKVHRNNKFHNPEGKKVVLKNIKASDKIGISLQKKLPSYFVDDPQWYIGIAASFEEDKDSKNAPASNYILGIDLGWREAAAYTIIDTNNYNPEEKNFSVVESGFLKWGEGKFFKKEFSGKKLFDSSAPQCPDSIFDIIQRLKEMPTEDAKEDDSEEEENFNAEPNLYNAVNLAKKLIVSKVKNYVSKEMLDISLELVSAVSPCFSSRRIRSHGVEQGGLGFKRFEMLENLKKLMSKIISVSERHNRPVPKAEFSRSRIQQKIVNLRKERARLTARMIINKAVEKQCLTSIENILISSDRRKAKWINKGNSAWCVRQIIKSVKDGSQEFGNKVYEANPRLTSHLDLDGSPVCRFVKINPQTIKEKAKKGRRYSSISSLEDSLKTYLKGGQSETDAIYKEAAARFLKGRTFREVLQDAKDKGLTSLLVPKRGGEFVVSKFLGTVHSDVMASHIMAQRAYEWSRKKNTEAASKTDSVSKTVSVKADRSGK